MRLASIYLVAVWVMSCHKEAGARAVAGHRPSVVSTGGGESPTPGPPPPVPARYKDAQATESPITINVANHLREIAALGRGTLDPHVFMKVGDSITYSSWFMSCFSGQDPNHNQTLDIGNHRELEPAIDFFRLGNAAGTMPFDRVSVACKVGATADWALTPNPDTGGAAPLDAESAAIHPQYAVIMYGTNDLSYGRNPSEVRGHMFRAYADHMYAILDRLESQGIVPIMSAVPPRLDTALQVPTLNAVVRGIAQSHQLPFVDLFRELAPLAGSGVGSDGVHPSIFVSEGVPRGCYLTPDGLAFGYNVRNLVTLSGLWRAMSVVEQKVVSLDPEPAALQGSGTAAAPVLIDQLPFSDHGDTRKSTSRALNGYSCAGAEAMPGREVVYRLELNQRTAVRALLLGKGAGSTCESYDLDCSGLHDAQLYLLGDQASAQSCLAHDNTIVQRTLDPVSYHFVVDTYGDDNALWAGEYLLVITTCAEGDATCQ